MSMHVAPCLNNVNITIGSTGAVSSFVGTIVASVVRVSTGIYTINMQPLSNFNAMLYAAGSAQSPSSGLSGVLGIEVQNAPNASIQSISAPSLTIKCLDAAGALVDPASGSVISVIMLTNNSGTPA